MMENIINEIKQHKENVNELAREYWFKQATTQTMRESVELYEKYKPRIDHLQTRQEELIKKMETQGYGLFSYKFKRDNFGKSFYDLIVTFVFNKGFDEKTNITI